jgi:catechol 2,3-dioxygenase-like lactoylglutathione lyase family enzyme
MLSDCQVHTTIPVADIARAISWYEEKLGLKPLKRVPGGVLYETAEDTRFLLYPTPNAGKGPQTIMGFVTDDVESEVEALRGRGVRFEDYDLPGLRTVEGIATVEGSKAAWFKDIDGNILAVVEAPD